jgi:prolipoprotein diacylglyceryltransferase
MIAALVWLAVAVGMLMYLILQREKATGADVVGAMMVVSALRPVIEFFFRAPMHFFFAGVYECRSENMGLRVGGLIFSMLLFCAGVVFMVWV